MHIYIAVYQATEEDHRIECLVVQSLTLGRELGSRKRGGVLDSTLPCRECLAECQGGRHFVYQCHGNYEGRPPTLLLAAAAGASGCTKKKPRTIELGCLLVDSEQRHGDWK